MINPPPKEGDKRRLFMAIIVTDQAVEQIKERYRSLERPFRIMVNGFG